MSLYLITGCTQDICKKFLFIQKELLALILIASIFQAVSATPYVKILRLLEQLSNLQSL